MTYTDPQKAGFSLIETPSFVLIASKSEYRVLSYYRGLNSKNEQSLYNERQNPILILKASTLHSRDLANSIKPLSGGPPVDQRGEVA